MSTRHTFRATNVAAVTCDLQLGCDDVDFERTLLFNVKIVEFLLLFMCICSIAHYLLQLIIVLALSFDNRLTMTS